MFETQHYTRVQMVCQYYPDYIRDFQGVRPLDPGASSGRPVRQVGVARPLAMQSFVPL